MPEIEWIHLFKNRHRVIASMASNDNGDDNHQPVKKDIVADRKHLVDEIEKAERSANELKYKLDKLDFDIATEKYSKWIGKIFVMSESGEPDIPPIGVEKQSWKYRKIMGTCADDTPRDIKIQYIDIDRIDWHEFHVKCSEIIFYPEHGKEAFPFMREIDACEFEKAINKLARVLARVELFLHDRRAEF